MLFDVHLLVGVCLPLTFPIGMYRASLPRDCDEHHGGICAVIMGQLVFKLRLLPGFLPRVAAWLGTLTAIPFFFHDDKSIWALQPSL